MGKPGAPPPTKAAGTAVDLRNGERVKLTEPGEKIPLPDSIRRPEAIAAWDDYWDDPVSSIVTKADHAMLYRWIDMVNRYWVLLEEADTEKIVVTTSNGQLANPLYKVALGIGNQIERLEIKLGIGPKNRASLGIQIIEQETSRRKLDKVKSDAKATTLELSEPEADPRMI